MVLVRFKIANKHCGLYWVEKEEMGRDERKSKVQTGNEMQILQKASERKVVLVRVWVHMEVSM